MVKLTCPRSTSRGIWHSLGIEPRLRSLYPMSSTPIPRTHHLYWKQPDTIHWNTKTVTFLNYNDQRKVIFIFSFSYDGKWLETLASFFVIFVFISIQKENVLQNTFGWCFLMNHHKTISFKIEISEF